MLNVAVYGSQLALLRIHTMDINLKKILYPTDFSDLSLCALPYATALAEQFGAELHCLHVVDDTCYYWMGASESAVPMMAGRDELWQSSEKQMTEFSSQRLGKLQSGAVTKMIAGRPFLEIIRYAKDEEIDLIVIATHGRGGLASVLLGSVAEKVVRKSPCPVLTVRHPEHEFVMP